MISTCSEVLRREHDAAGIVSNASAKVLFLNMIDAPHMSAELITDVKNFRMFSTAIKINVAANRLPQYRGLERARAVGALGNWTHPTYCHLANDIEHLERAHDDAKYGWYSSNPFLTPVSPSVVDNSLAPPGIHTINFFGGHAPYELKGSNWPAEDAFRTNVFQTIDRFAPGFSEDVIDAEVLTASDIESIVNLPQGQIFHDELAPDQLFFKRSVPHYANYRTPLAGLYLPWVFGGLPRFSTAPVCNQERERQDRSPRPFCNRQRTETVWTGVGEIRTPARERRRISEESRCQRTKSRGSRTLMVTQRVCAARVSLLTSQSVALARHHSARLFREAHRRAMTGKRVFLSLRSKTPTALPWCGASLPETFARSVKRSCLSAYSDMGPASKLQPLSAPSASHAQVRARHLYLQRFRHLQKSQNTHPVPPFSGHHTGLPVQPPTRWAPRQFPGQL